MAAIDTMTHEQLVTWAIDYLNHLPGSYAYATHGGWASKPKTKGITDVENVRGGVAHYYEVKIGKDTVRPAQLRFRDKVREAGAHWNVIRSPEDLVACVIRENSVEMRLHGLRERGEKRRG